MRSNRRHWLCVTLGLGAVPRFPARQSMAIQHTEPCMGTLVTIRAHHPDEALGYRAIAAAFRRMHALDAILSDYRPDSELNQLCRTAHTAPFTASPDLFRVLQESLHMAEATGGAFCPTIGPLVHLWRQARRQRALPSQEALHAARTSTAWQGIQLDSHTHRVCLPRSGMQIDFGGIGKGYAADQALAELARHGVTRALVAASGDIAAGAAPPDADAWSVALDSGLEAQPRVAALRHQAVSTSGDRHQHLEIGSIRYSHIVDPRTGIGLTEPLAVSVVAPSAMESDSAATALSVMGFARAQQWLASRPGLQARLVRVIPGHSPDIWQSPGFPLSHG